MPLCYLLHILQINKTAAKPNKKPLWHAINVSIKSEALINPTLIVLNVQKHTLTAQNTRYMFYFPEGHIQSISLSDFSY